MLQETINIPMALAVDAELAARALAGTTTARVAVPQEKPRKSPHTATIDRIRSHAAASMAQMRPVVYV